MASITRFNFPFRGGYSFYTGTGSTQLVPHVFPVAINGRPYMIDTASNQFFSQFDSRVRDSVDQSAEPGESAINPQGLWRRSQSSWHYGAGQTYADTADAEPYRFRSSKGVDVWTKGQLSLLQDTSVAYPTSNTNLYMTTADGRIYGTDGQSVKYTSDWSTFNTVTGTAASNLYSITSDGYNVFYSYANGDIDQTNAATTSSSAYITGIEAGVVKVVRGRLMVAGQGVDKHKIWNITTPPGSSQNNPGALYTHPNTNFNWVDFAGGQSHIYCAGYAGNKTLIYKTQIKADGTSLDIPTVAGELPQGEVVSSIESYLGYILVGLTNGFRFCSADDNGNLTIGPLIETGTNVKCFVGIGKFVYFGWTNYDSTSTGLGRIDISVQISTNQPAYASDVMATGQGTVLDVHEFAGDPVFTVSGLGAYKLSSNLVTSGTMDTGIYRWGIPDLKFVPKWDMRTKSLDGSIAFYISNDGASFELVGLQSTGDSLESTFDGSETRAFETEARIVLTRSDTSSSLGPVLTRWMGRAYAAPLRSRMFSVPILLHHVINMRGKDYWFDVDEELNRLVDLVENPRIITYQENVNTHSVVVEDIRWQPVDQATNHAEWDWNGTCIVIMRSVR